MRRDDVKVALSRLAPRLPAFEREAVCDHAIASAGLRKASLEEAAWLSLVAFVRHRMTDYDALLSDGYDVESARFAVADDMQAMLAGWGVKRVL